MALAAALVAVLAACAPPPAPVPAPSPQLQRFYDQRLAWGPCADFATTAADRSRYARPNFQCARLEVPLDYARPDDRTARIAVLRQRATGPDRIGSLVFNPGGPGASGNRQVVRTAPDLAGSPLSARFDLVGFDPRGTGASTPALDCLTDAEWAQERLDQDIDPSPAGVAQTEAENAEYARRCAERSGGPDVLGNVGTRDVVRDLDVLRAVLGDARLSFLGYSYGTRIGSMYAEAFPGGVRALVLDGALDPKESTVDRIVKQNAAFQAAFETYAADCARSPACPLGTDPAQATARFQALVRPLVDAPLAVGDRQMSFDDATIGVVQALYAQYLWPRLTQSLSAYATGDGSGLLELADSYFGRGADGVYSNFYESFGAISCMDEERIPTPRGQAELVEAAKRAAPFRDDGRPAVAARDRCDFWPATPTQRPHVPQVQGLPPTVVISTTGDPATPYRAGVELAAGLGARLLTFEGTQHAVALSGVSCVDEAVTAYLVDLRVPPEGLRCAA